MANPGISDELLIEAREALEKHGTPTAAARALGIPPSTLRSRIVASERVEKKREETPPPVGVKGDIDIQSGTGWLELTDYKMPSPEDILKKYDLDPLCWRVTRLSPNQWQGFYKKGDKETATAQKVTLCQLKIWIERIVPESVEAVAKVLAERIKPLPAPKKRAIKDITPLAQLAVFGLYDAHIGSLCWGEEVGKDYDTNIAGRRAKNAVDDILDDVGRYEIGKILIPVGNDFMHFDNYRGETSSGRVTVDQDSRYPRVLRACHDVLAHQVDRSLEFCDDIEILLVRGNHDMVASLHLCHWLKQRYRNDPRVSVDVGPGVRKYRTWGKTLLGFTHGDKINPKETFRIMADEASEHWNGAVCREWHTGDKHHRKQIDQVTVDSVGSVTFRINPSLAQSDAWHHEQGYNAVRCADVWRYGEHGFAGMASVYARDK
jgi:hypothetical protein